MDFDRIDPGEWATAQRRAEILSALPERPSGDQIRDAMVALGVGRTTLFRWLKQFREGARTSALLPRRRGPNSGMRPLAPEVLAIVERHFRDFYATRRRPTVTRLWAEIAADCRREGLEPFRPFVGSVDGWPGTMRRNCCAGAKAKGSPSRFFWRRREPWRRPRRWRSCRSTTPRWTSPLSIPPPG